MASTEVQVDAYEGVLDGMPVYFINGEPIRASGSVYSSNNKLDAEKYAFFSLAALRIAASAQLDPEYHSRQRLAYRAGRLWQPGQALGAKKRGRVSSLVTIHNLPFMGPNVRDILEEYGSTACKH